jgi:hypothetical protein
MVENITIRLPRKMSVSDQLSEVKKQLSAWLQTLERPYDVEKHCLKLSQFQKNATEYRYSYSMASREEVSASRVGKMGA